MAVNQDINDALRLDSLTLPASMDVQAVKVEEYTNAEGEPALRVLVVIGEGTDPARIPGEDVGDLKSSIRESLRQRGITLFPYTFIAKSSELAESGDDEFDDISDVRGLSVFNDLIQQAEMLATVDRRRPIQANLRRAVSAVYYAVFHLLVEEACINLIGTQIFSGPIVMQ